MRAELFFDPQTHTPRGVAMGTVIDGLVRAQREAETRWGLTSKLILCFLRHLSEDDAFATLEAARPYLHHLAGVGLDSGERGNPPAKFERVFTAARAMGLTPVAHAGEEGPAAYIREALDRLAVVRIDHGVRCDEDPALVDELAARRVPLTVCPLSNLKLRVFPTLAQHNLGAMLEAGIVASSGEVVVLLHADTWVPQDAFAAIARRLSSAPDVVGGGFRKDFRDGPSLLRFGAVMRSGLYFRLTGLLFGDQAMFVRRSALEGCGGMPAWALMEDLELSRRLRKVGRLVLLPEVVRTSGRRFGQQGTLRTWWRMARAGRSGGGDGLHDAGAVPVLHGAALEEQVEHADGFRLRADWHRGHGKEPVLVAWRESGAGRCPVAPMDGFPGAGRRAYS